MILLLALAYTTPAKFILAVLCKWRQSVTVTYGHLRDVITEDVTYGHLRDVITEVSSNGLHERRVDKMASKNCGHAEATLWPDKAIIS